MGQSKWDQHDLEGKIETILEEARSNDERPHFGRPVLTCYQIAIQLEKRWGVGSTLGMPIGGKGTNKRNSLTQYIAKELTARLKKRTLRNKKVQGFLLSREDLRSVVFNDENGQPITSTVHPAWDTTMFRMAD